MHYVRLTTALILFAIVESYGQFTEHQFEQQVLEFHPERSEGVSEKAIQFAEMVLEETRSATKGEPSALNVADYMNVLSVFATLQRPLDDQLLALRKLCAAEDHCMYLKAFRQKVMDNEKYAPVRDAWLVALQDCAQGAVHEEEGSPTAYADKHHLDPELIRALDEIKQADQSVRKGRGESDKDQMQSIDNRNQARIDSLFRTHKTYLGKSLAGERYQWVMWSVIQHAPLAYMEKYLPTVHLAYLKNELSAAPFKMLLDRYHGLKFGYQVFGSQSGFGFRNADEATRERVKRKYGVPD